MGGRSIRQPRHPRPRDGRVVVLAVDVVGVAPVFHVARLAVGQHRLAVRGERLRAPDIDIGAQRRELAREEMEAFAFESHRRAGLS